LIHQAITVIHSHPLLHLAIIQYIQLHFWE
jgi:hypothetical protein